MCVCEQTTVICNRQSSLRCITSYAELWLNQHLWEQYQVQHCWRPWCEMDSPPLIGSGRLRGYLKEPHVDVNSLNHHLLALTRGHPKCCEVAGELTFLFPLRILPYAGHLFNYPRWDGRRSRNHPTVPFPRWTGGRARCECERTGAEEWLPSEEHRAGIRLCWISPKVCKRSRLERSTHGRWKTRRGEALGGGGVNEGGEAVKQPVCGEWRGRDGEGERGGRGSQPHSLPPNSSRGEMRLADGRYHTCWSESWQKGCKKKPSSSPLILRRCSAFPGVAPKCQRRKGRCYIKKGEKVGV